MASVGPASISSLSKSFRTQLMGRDPNYKYPLDINGFTVQDVAERASRMFAQAATDAGISQWPKPEGLGYIVAGMSTGCDQAEVWLLKFEGLPLEAVPQEVSKPNSESPAGSIRRPRRSARVRERRRQDGSWRGCVGLCCPITATK